MLLFLDQAKNYKVMRTQVDDDGTTRRERLGLVPKNTLEVSADLRALLDEPEKVEVDKVVKSLREARSLTNKVNALNFPEKLREAIEYIAEEADDVERHFLVTAILDGVRQIRKMERSE